MNPVRSMLCFLGCELGVIVALVSLGDLRSHVALYLVLFAFAAAFALLACVSARRVRVPLLLIIAAALALRIPLFFTQPSLSDDVWRYLHDGRAQLAGVNPYAYAPSDTRTESFRSAEYARINHPDLPTIYPPVAQFAFRAVAWFADPLLAWRALLLLAELLIIVAAAALLRRHQRPVSNVALYAWHPLAILEGVGSAHVEPLAIALLMLALLGLAGSRQLTAGLALAGSVATKLIAAPLLILMIDRRALAGFAALLVLVYLPFTFADVHVLGSLRVFAETWTSNGSVYALLSPFMNPGWYRVTAAALLVGLVLVLKLKGHHPGDVVFAYFLAFFSLAPVVHPWYLLWVLAAVCLRAQPFDWLGSAALVWTVTVALGYVAHQQQLSTGIWQIPNYIVLIEYIPVYVAMGYGATRLRFSRINLIPNPKNIVANK